jgi:hypothetical protein
MSTLICHPPADWTCVGGDAYVTTLGAEMVDMAESFAWSMLAAMCAYQIASCPVTVRPCAASCFPLGTWVEAVVGGASASGLPVARLGGTIFTPHLTGGNWVNSCGCTSGDCGCTTLSEAILPGPVGDILAVRVDGVVQDPSTYRVDNGNRLVSLDPDRPWPLCQDMSLDPDEIGVFEVSYYQGAAPNTLTSYAAGVLANEYVLACKKDSKCRIPRNATTVTRGGTTIELETDVRKALMRIPEVASVVSIFNPNGLTSPPRVLSPTTRRPRRTTWVG